MTASGAAQGDRVLAGYRLVERLAVGGMAEIFRAIREGPGDFAKTVAIKMVLPDLCRDPQFVEMFLEEARLAARLGSPHLVQVFDFGQQQGSYFLVMEYLDGGDLAGLLAQHGALELELSVFVARQLCAALVDLHRAADESGEPLHIVHRDVNPGNVLLSSAGDVKLGDFGIAKARARASRTERGAIKGKLAYLSPEQVRGEEVDQRSDIYGLGLVLFETLVGERYLRGDDEATLLRAAERPPFRKPSSLRPELPGQIDTLLERALAVEPANRFPDARTFDAALAKLAFEDRAELRQRLAALLVQGTPSTATQPRVVPMTPSAAAPVSDMAAASRPQTEVLGGAAAPSRGWPWVAAVGVLLVVGASLALYVTRYRQHSAAVDLGRSSSDTSGRRDAGAVADVSNVSKDVIDVIDAIDAIQSRSDLSSSPDRGDHRIADAAVTKRRAIRRAPARRPSQPARSPSSARRDSGAETSDQRDAARPTPDRASAHLAAVDRELRRKGISSSDAPALYARRQQLQEASDELAALQLLARVRALRVDRAFIEAKLRRLDRRIAVFKGDAASKQRLRQRAAHALSHAVTGRYTEANRELNEIARALDRR